MEAPGIAWAALVLGALLLGGGLALVAEHAQQPEVADCDPRQHLCPQTEALRAGTGSMMGWAAIGMALVMDVLFLGLTRGGQVLT